MGMTQDYVNKVMDFVKPGDTVRWCDLYDTQHNENRDRKIEEGIVISKHPRFCVTNKGSISWGLIAGYFYQIEFGKGHHDINR